MSKQFIRKDITIVLASKSPRRRELIKDLLIPFRVINIETDEHYPKQMNAQDVPVFLAKTKAIQVDNLSNNEVLVTADTVVIYENKILEKPSGASEAKQFLKLLSNNKHLVVTGVCLSYIKEKKEIIRKCFSSSTEVRFKNLTTEEIEFYVNQFQPYDKAGAYGIQEWIGKIGVEYINGDFYNVMGLPLVQLFQHLHKIRFK